jgi:hypothetical protein
MKERIKISSILFVGIIAFTVIGCGFFPETDLSKNDAILGYTPYADITLLNQLAEVEGNVDWRIARFFALVNLEEFRQENKWTGAVLSERPLIIYRASNETPRYYEFRVICKGEEIGAITCVVEKEEGEAVQYVIPFATQISEENSRSILANQGKIIDTGYPKITRIRTSGNRSIVDPTTGIEDTGNYFVDVKAREFLEQMNPEDLEAFGITSQQIYDSYIAKFLENENRIQMFWEKVYEDKDRFLAMSDEEIHAAFLAVNPHANARSLYSSDYRYLNAWINRRDWSRPQYTLWCGPVALYFATLGLGSNSGYAGIPTSSSDLTKINAMYKMYENYLGTGATTFIAMNNALASYTNYYLHNASLADAHTWNYSFASMLAGMPVISLRSGWPTIFDPWHYRVIVGTCKETFRDWILFGYVYSYKDWYYVWDAGVDSSGWPGIYWEKADQLYQLFTTRLIHK